MRSELDADFYDDPAIADPYPLYRAIRDHPGCGHGVHGCAGSHVAQLEMQALLRAMVGRVRHVTVADPALGVNDVRYGHRSFRAAFR